MLGFLQTWTNHQFWMFISFHLWKLCEEKPKIIAVCDSFQVKREQQIFIKKSFEWDTYMLIWWHSGTQCGSQRKKSSESVNTLHLSSFVVYKGKHLDSVCIKRENFSQQFPGLKSVWQVFFTQKVFPVYGIGQFLSQAKFWRSVTTHHFSSRLLLSHKPTIVLSVYKVDEYYSLNNDQHEGWLHSNHAWRTCNRHLVEQSNFSSRQAEWSYSSRREDNRIKFQLQTSRQNAICNYTDWEEIGNEAKLNICKIKFVKLL